MLRISNIPPEIFAAALRYEGLPRPSCLQECPEFYESETAKRAWTQGGLEKAIFEYLTLTGPFFNEDDGEFAGCSGYTYSVGDSEIEMVS